MSRKKEIEHIENYRITMNFWSFQNNWGQILEYIYITTDFFLISLLKDKWYLYAIVRQR